MGNPHYSSECVASSPEGLLESRLYAENKSLQSIYIAAGLPAAFFYLISVVATLVAHQRLHLPLRSVQGKPLLQQEFIMIQIQLSNVTLILGAKHIFENLNWEIQHGQKIGLIGPNGAGKSSLFKLITDEYSAELVISSFRFFLRTAGAIIASPPFTSMLYHRSKPCGVWIKIPEILYYRLS